MASNKARMIDLDRLVALFSIIVWLEVVDLDLELEQLELDDLELDLDLEDSDVDVLDDDDDVDIVEDVVVLLVYSLLIISSTVPKYSG